VSPKILYNKYSASQIEITNIYLNALYPIILNQLSEDIERCYKLNWRSNNYEVFLGNFVLLMSHVIHDRWITISNNAAPHNKSLNITIPKDFLEFSEWCVTSDTFNCHVHLILGTILASNKASTYVLPTSAEGYAGIDNNVFDNSKVLVDSPYFLNSKFEENEFKSCNDKDCVFVFNDRRQHSKYFNLNKQFRTESLEAKINNFEEACLALCKLYIPVDYLESLTALKVLKKAYPPKAVYTSIGCHFNTPIKYLVGEYINKIPYWIHQHGGGYGMLNTVVPEFYERRVASKYFTWGWIEDSKTSPLPTKPRINRYDDPKVVLLKTLLGCKYRKYLILDNPIYKENIDLTKSTIAFLQKISPRIQLHIAHYENNKTNIGVDINELYHNNSKHFPDRSRPDGAYKIHVCNYLGTSWLESISSDIPTIVFIESNKYSFRPNAKILIDELIDIGIIHHSPESAADHLNNVYDNPDKWWNSSELQNIRSKFTKKYANFNSNWPSYWQSNFANNLKLIN